MSWGIFKIYDWMRDYKTPKWLKELLGDVQDIMMRSVLSLSNQAFMAIEEKISEVANLGVSNKEKFEIVFKYARSIGIVASETILNILINSLYLRFKEKASMM